MTVAGGEFLATTATLTTSSPEAPVGSYRVADIPTPGVYAVTFSKEGFVDETRDVEFTAPGVQPDVSVVARGPTTARSPARCDRRAAPVSSASPSS